MARRSPLGAPRRASTLLSPLFRCASCAALLLMVALLANPLLPLGRPIAASPREEDPPKYTLDLSQIPEAKETKGHSALESALSDLADLYRQAGPEAARRYAAERQLALRGDLVLVIVEAHALDLASESVKELGGTVEARYGDLLQALIPVAALPELAERPAVRYVRPPLPRTSTTVVSEGVQVTGVLPWHGVSLDGAGLKVAILDLGFSGYQALLGSELPESVVVRSFTGDITGGGEVHGTACAELVHDMAPGAQLYLVNFGTEVEFAQAVDWLIEQEVDIISCSVAWVNAGPYDGTGVINAIVDRACAHGILWANAMGNQARRHWEGSFKDTDKDRWHEYGPGVEINTLSVSAGQSVDIFLSWDDSWTNATQDYDLYLLRWTGSQWVIVAASMNAQNGSPGQTPTEGLSFVAQVSGLYGAAVRRYKATQEPHLELYSFTHDFAQQVQGSSLLIPADNRQVLSMGAFRCATGEIESFSSRGPTNDGRIKPDLLGPDFVSTVTYGPGGFGGTSPAAPHAAGAAALLKQAFPAWGPAEIKQYLMENAITNPGQPQGSAFIRANNPPNNDAGAGNLALGTPPLDAVDIALAPGWNLVSVPIAPVNTAITQVLSSIEGSYDLVYAYDAHDPSNPWKIYNVAFPPFLNTLTEINERMGFWIQMSEARTLTVVGRYVGVSEIPLAIGWNLVDYPSRVTRPVEVALASIAGKYDLIYAYDAHDPSEPWKIYNVAFPPFLNTLTEMVPGWGYWINATEECVWRISDE